jgi:hypothetical protein
VTYWLDGPGIESLVPTQALYNDTGFFPMVKRLGRGVDYPNPSNTEVKETVELHIYSFS